MHTQLLGACLLYVVFPLWLAAGIADYVCHRRTEIERNSGFAESLFHLGQAVLLGAGILVGLFYRLNGLVIGIIALCVLLHFVLSVWDTAYTYRLRPIGPLEQHVHGLLDVLPFMAACLAAMAGWVHLFNDPVVLSPHDVAIGRGTIATVLVLIAVLNLAPLLEELVRTWRARRPEHAPALRRVPTRLS